MEIKMFSKLLCCFLPSESLLSFSGSPGLRSVPRSLPGPLAGPRATMAPACLVPLPLQKSLGSWGFWETGWAEQEVQFGLY